MSSNRRSFLHDLAATSAGCSLPGAAGANPGQPVTCRVVDARTGRGLAARLRLVDAEGKEVVPLGHPEALAENAQEGDVRFQSRVVS